MFNLAKIYTYKTNYDEAIKYYLLSYENGFKIALLHLGILYHNLHNYKFASKYINMFVSEQGLLDYDDLTKHVSAVEIDDLHIDIFILYHYLGEKYYKNITGINIYKNKLKKFSTKAECEICYNGETICIPLECTHYVCTNCYTHFCNESCPFCRCEFKI